MGDGRSHKVLPSLIPPDGFFEEGAKEHPVEAKGSLL